MNGEELIRWIKENHAEQYELLTWYDPCEGGYYEPTPVVLNGKDITEAGEEREGMFIYFK